MNTNKILLSLSVCMFLIACGGGGSPSDSASETETTTSDSGTDVSTGTNQTTQVAALGTGSGTSFNSASMSVLVSDLAAGGSTEVSVNIVDISANSAIIVGTEYAVRFSSECADQEPAKAVFQQDEIFTSSGSASTFYQAQGCAGEDRLSASLFLAENGAVIGDVLDAAVGFVTVELAEVNNIEFVESSPSSLALKGLGFTILPETSAVSFLVRDEFNNPISGKAVSFSLTNNSVGVTLAGDSDLDGTVDALTDANGIAIAYVNSGSTNASVSVIASTTKNTGGAISTQSFPISITTGVADQNSYNLVVDVLNPHSWDVDDTEVTLSVRGADSFQNPIPDGTEINFIAESGQVQPRCITAGGGCSVIWTSTNPRPGLVFDPAKNDGSMLLKTNDVSSPAYDAAWQGGRAGVATVLAYSLGEGGFYDANGSGLLDVGENYYTMAEAYLDANEDGQFTASNDDNPYEKLVDFDANGVQTSASVNYQGVSCSLVAKAAGHCSEMVHVRDQLSFIVADGRAATINLTGITGGSTGDLTSPSIPSCINVRSEGSVTFSFNVTDSNGNIPPTETQVAFDADGFELVGSAPTNVPNAFSTSGIDYSVTIKPDDTFENGSAVFEITSIREIITAWTSPELSDDPRILVSTDSYLLDVAAATQSVVYSFRDACGNPPANSDIILFELANAQLNNFGGVTKRQFSGADLTAGDLTVVFEDDGTPSTGDVKITTIKDGFSSETIYEITD